MSSIIWEIGLYTKNKQNKDSVECIECKKPLNTARGSTSGLIRHLSKHPEFEEKYKGLQADTASKHGTIEKFASIHGSGCIFLHLENFYSILLGELNALDKKIIHYIACTNGSFKQINHPTFHALFSANHPLQTIKDEKHYREWVLPRVFERVQKLIMECMEKCNYLSFTSDIWSGPSDSFIR